MSTVHLSSETRLQVKRARADLAEARHLPGQLYTSKEIFDYEVEAIFMKQWLCVGRAEEFANPGDFLATRIVGEPALIVRAEDGRLQAFRNVCRHRGVEVATGRGSAKEFTCPYHGWVYGLDGALIGAPHTREVRGFDIKTCSLTAIKLDTWGGYVFINFDPGCQSLGDYLDEDGVRDFLGFLQPQDTRLCDKFVFEVPCNWKFIPENLMDIYHVGVIHRESFGGYFPVNDFRFQLRKSGYSAVYESYTMAPGGVTLFGTMPWLRGKVTDKFACTSFLRPTMNFFARHDLIQPWVCTPIAVDRTKIEIYTQLPEAYFAEPGFEEKAKIYADFIRMAASEDEGMLRSLQNGVGSRGFEPGPTVKLERAIHHLLNYYLDRLLGDDDVARQRRISDGDAAIATSRARHAKPLDGGYAASFLVAG